MPEKRQLNMKYMYIKNAFYLHSKRPHYPNIHTLFIRTDIRPSEGASSVALNLKKCMDTSAQKYERRHL